jgi:hypothetical protein
MNNMLLLSSLFLLAGCAAAVPTPCQRQCNPLYDSCMDVTGAVDNPQAVRAIEAQCQTAQESCLRACERTSQ